ncbi:MAG: HAD-IIB family hydrolase [bacterium]|nr:HAD-IIB family hydrolase [bacterium]
MNDGIPKLVASDIGGTLIRGIHAMPAFTAGVLNRLCETGIPVVLITGFNYSTTKRFARDLDPRVLLMPQNGSLCIDGEKLVWEYRIPEPEAGALHDYLRQNNLPVIVYKGKLEDFGNFYISDRELPLSYAFQQVDCLKNFENITGISTLLPDEPARKVKDNIERIVGDKFKVIYTREVKGSWLETVHTDVRKDLALKRLCEELDIPLSEVIFFGDNFNDLEVLRMVGHPVLVENAAPELKEEFKTIAGPVTEEGVAVYLNALYNF